MSIIIPLIYSKDGAQVQRATVPVGYDLPTYDVFVQKMISEVLTHIRLFPNKLPAFDEVKSLAPGYPLVAISGDVFQPVFQFRQLLRAGADPKTILKLVSDHRNALAALDRSAYTDEQNTEWNDAGIAITILFNELSRENTVVR